MATKLEYLRSRRRRGRWFHYYRRNGKETPLGVHGLDENDARVIAAYASEHRRWQECPPETVKPAKNTLAWGIDLYLANSQHWKDLASETQNNRMAIFKRYRGKVGNRLLTQISTEDIEAGMEMKGGHGPKNELKALKPVFEFLKKIHHLKTNPYAAVSYKAPKIKGHPTADADEILRFKERWEIGTTERLVFDLALLTGSARADLAKIGRHNIQGNLLSFRRKKTNVACDVPITEELRAVIARTPDISPTFILNRWGKPYAPESIGNLFRDAAVEVNMVARLHGLRKAFCVYWAEWGAKTQQIAAMSGHLTLTEVQRYTEAADRKRMVRALLEVA